MPRITFLSADGARSDVEAVEGISLMRAALDNGVPGIIGDCGGELSCATCHVYLQPPWTGTFPAPDEAENVMVECVIDQRPESRLSCQLFLAAAHDGMLVGIPASQY